MAWYRPRMAAPTDSFVTLDDVREALEDVRKQFEATGQSIRVLDPVLGVDATGERTLGVLAVVKDELARTPGAAELMLDILDGVRHAFDEHGLAVWPSVSIIGESDVAALDEEPSP